MVKKEETWKLPRLFVEATSGIEPLMQLLQSRALPLGYVAAHRSILLIERETGFEPATSSLARKCSTTEPLPQMYTTAHWHVEQHRCFSHVALRYHRSVILSTG